MRLIYCKERERFETLSSFGERHASKNAGFRWDSGVRRWWTRDISVAHRMIEYADAELAGSLVQQLAAKSAAEQTALAASRATDADLDIPAPPGRIYYGYQRAGIAYALHRRDTLIADEMGLGKTIQGIGVINVSLTAQTRLRVLVVAPKIALSNWERELREWLIRPLGIARWTTAQQVDADVVIVNYDILTRPAIFEKLRAIAWDVAIFDEAHALKNRNAQRTRAVLGDRKTGTTPIEAGRRLFLTGTPILNRPIELFPLLNAMGISIAESYHQFAKRYCDGHNTPWGRFDASGASNPDELQKILRQTCMVRRLKADVLTDLPEKRYQLIELDIIDEEMREAVNAEQKASKAWNVKIAELKRQVKAAELSGDKKALHEAMSRLKEGRVAELAEISKLRHQTALAKVPQVVEHAAAVLDATSDAVLLFAHHLDVIEKLRQGLAKIGYEAAIITGDVGEAERERAQSDIREHRKRLFIGSMHACGVAINLPEASTVLFAEADWTPGVMAQCEDRAHRIGQRNSVLVQHLVLAGSIDAEEVADSIDPQMARTLVRKEIVIEKALDRASDAEARFVTYGTKSSEGSLGSELDNVNYVPGQRKAETAPEASGVPVVVGRKRGRPPLGERPMTKTERNRRSRQKSQRATLEVPKDVVDLLREIRMRTNDANANILRRALQRFAEGLGGADKPGGAAGGLT